MREHPEIITSDVPFALGSDLPPACSTDIRDCIWEVRQWKRKKKSCTYLAKKIGYCIYQKTGKQLKNPKLSMSPFSFTVSRWAWCNTTTSIDKVHLLPTWIWSPKRIFLPKMNGQGLTCEVQHEGQIRLHPSTRDNQSLPQSPFCLPVSHRSFSLRYSLFILSLKQTSPLFPASLPDMQPELWLVNHYAQLGN